MFCGSTLISYRSFTTSSLAFTQGNLHRSQSLQCGPYAEQEGWESNFGKGILGLACLRHMSDNGLTTSLFDVGIEVGRGSELGGGRAVVEMTACASTLARVAAMAAVGGAGE